MKFRQSEFLGEFAELYQGFTGIGYWYIGLSDLCKIPLSRAYTGGARGQCPSLDLQRGPRTQSFHTFQILN